MNTFLQNILGPGNTPANFLSNYFFAVVGVVLLLLIQVAKRNPESRRTPFCFNFHFLTYDNAGRLLMNAILIFVYIRFYKEITGNEITLWLSFVVGFCLDLLATSLQKFRVLDTGQNLQKFKELKPENEHVA